MVVLHRSENTRFVGRNGCVPWNDHPEYVALHRDTKGERCNVEKQQVLCLFRNLTGKDCGLDSSAMGNGFIRVDGFVELAVSKVFGDQRLDFRDARRATDKNNFIDFLARDLRILQYLFDGFDGRFEKCCIDLLEARTCDVRREVLPLVQVLFDIPY